MDGLLLLAERVARQVYWSLPRLRAWARPWRSRASHPLQVARRDELKQYLREIGMTEGALAMVHTSVSGLSLQTDSAANAAPANFLTTARQLVDDLFEVMGDTGTLTMPTHAVYQAEDFEPPLDKGDKIVTYDPARTPCAVGLANELFWRRKGVQRSLHPYNMLAARGPLADELLRDNLNDDKPLPHGVHSSYYRFCLRNGLLVSIGVPLGRYMTCSYVAEEVRDAEWPIKDYFEERRYIVRGSGRDDPWIVRQSRPEFHMHCRCIHKYIRDLRREGILHEGRVGTVRVNWARAKEVFDYFMSRNRISPYPYYGTSFIGRSR
jgi:aminoglycoside 3-N-acetyltransferase